MKIETASTASDRSFAESVHLRSVERRLVAIGVIIGLHLAILAIGAVATALLANGLRLPVLPHEPLQLVAVSLVMAHCSLGAIWWARTKLSPNVKTLLAVLSCGGLWLLLLALLDTARDSGVVAAAWAMSIATQVVVTAAATTALELWLNYQAAAARSRFNLSFLLIWTSVIAVGLGSTGGWASRHGWNVADVPLWQYFRQLQFVALLNALLAQATYCSARLPTNKVLGACGALVATIAVAAAAPALMIGIFGKEVGATVAEMAWIFAAQGLFLAATLVPLEIAKQGSYISK